MTLVVGGSLIKQLSMTLLWKRNPDLFPPQSRFIYS